MSIRPIAIYLPQYYPIPENDEWLGKGFTEWTDAAKARPLFKGHYQPKLPADLGFYDLRVPEVREAQAALAKSYGIEGFCYYHYWFGNGKQLLERPFNEVLDSGKPDFPFCLYWANEDWDGIKPGSYFGKKLIVQTYPGVKDYELHFYSLLKAFNDKRYIKVDGKPVFAVYKTMKLPHAKLFSDTVNNLAIKNGFPGMYLMAGQCPQSWNPLQHGFNAVIGSEFQTIRLSQFDTKFYSLKKIKQSFNNTIGWQVFKPTIRLFRYQDIADSLITSKEFSFDYYPVAIPNWDNTARFGKKALIFHDCKPELFAKHLQKAFDKVKQLPTNRRFVFLKSWNEWGEGNYLEPDQVYGLQYLEILKQQLDKFNKLH